VTQSATTRPADGRIEGGPAVTPGRRRKPAHHGRGRSAPGGRGRRRVPTVIQMEAAECGAACLAMILGYYGKFVPLEELRTACGVSRDGARASAVMAAARTYGLIARGFQMEARELATAPKPLMIYWAFQHFMVLEGIRRTFGKTVVVVNDPASGPRDIEWDEFDSGFTGIVLTFEPGPDFSPGGHPSRILAALMRRRQRTGRALPLILLASLLLIPAGIVTPAFSRVFIDRVLAGQSGSFVTPLLGAILATAVITLVLTSVQQHYLLNVETRLALFGSARFFRRLLRLPVEFFMQRQPAEVAKRVSANDQVAVILTRDLATAVLNLVLVVFYAAVLVRYDVLLGAIGITTALLNVVVLRCVARIRTDAVAALRADRGRLMTASFNTLFFIETVKATGAEQAAFARWAGFLAKVVSGRQRLGMPTAVLTVVPPLLATANTGLILLVGGLKVVDGGISIGILVAFQGLLTSLSRPVTQLTNLGESLQDITADITRLHDVERYPLDRAFAHPGSVTQARLDGYLDFDNVTFGYNPLAPPVLKNVSFSVVPGRRLAIVGGSGSGKSTIGRLIAGLYDPWSGQVLLDGRYRAEIAREVIASSVAFVDQEISLFEGTIRDNLTLWDDETSDEAVSSALRDAAIFDLVAGRAGGIHSRMDEGGRNFSGGQRQRLELARALVPRPTMLVLDEATSALDPDTEQVIADNLRRRGCACVIIAHRLSTVRDADEIIVLDHGDIVERGRHYDLMAANGHYASLIAASEVVAVPGTGAGGRDG
jgi:NHLM bacteriocin system ABC transporter peptidase/ATP-binding protein